MKFGRVPITERILRRLPMLEWIIGSADDFSKFSFTLHCAPCMRSQLTRFDEAGRAARRQAAGHRRAGALAASRTRARDQRGVGDLQRNRACGRLRRWRVAADARRAQPRSGAAHAAPRAPTRHSRDGRACAKRGVRRHGARLCLGGDGARHGRARGLRRRSGCGVRGRGSRQPCGGGVGSRQSRRARAAGCGAARCRVHDARRDRDAGRAPRRGVVGRARRRRGPGPARPSHRADPASGGVCGSRRGA